MWWTTVTGTSMGTRGDLRRRCQAVLRRYHVPRPFDFDRFRGVIEQVRGRRLVLVPVQTQASSPCGLWIADPDSDTDYIMFEAGTSPLHRVHIALHEIGHMIMGHTGLSPFAPEFLAHALPDLDHSTVQRVLARTTFTSRDEAEAEMLATLVGEWGALTQVRHPEVGRVPDLADQLDRLAAALGQPHEPGW